MYFETNATGTATGWEVAYVALPNPLTKTNSQRFLELVAGGEFLFCFENSADHHFSHLTAPTLTPPTFGNHLSPGQMFRYLVGPRNDEEFDSDADCGVVNYAGRSGIIQLPGYGKPYKNNMMCEYRVGDGLGCLAIFQVLVEEGFVVQVRLTGSTADDGDFIIVFENFCIHYDIGTWVLALFALRIDFQSLWHEFRRRLPHRVEHAGIRVDDGCGGHGRNWVHGVLDGGAAG